ncbi:MAG: Na/Pi symporter [Arcobacteraceae bacterium]
MLKKVLFSCLLLCLAYFVLSNENAKVIVAGIAIFLIGMYFMDEGFKLFSGSTLERILENFTNTLPKAIATGAIATSIVQSSTLTSVIMLSFLSAGLIGLSEAIGVIFGSNLGSTTTTWLVSYFGLKINIAYYAMPMLIFGVTLRFSKNTKYQGAGNILLGVGFIFLGISYMMNGFETLKDTINLSQYSMNGYLGVMVYILIGIIATVIIQSSAATMAIVIAALVSQQIVYENALAISIGANIGTTLTAIVGSLASNENGKRLAVAHFIFNAITALVAFIFIYQMAEIVDYVASIFNVSEDNYVIKLAIFHTLFNVTGIILVAPFTQKMVTYLETLFIPKIKAKSKPLYLSDEVIGIPKAAIINIRKEVMNLYLQSLKAISHAMNLHRDDIFSQNNIQEIIKKSKTKIETNIDEIYKENLKQLFGEIIRFSSLAQQNMNEEEIKIVGRLKYASRKIIKSLKDIKELQKNINFYSNSKNEYIKNEYDAIREVIANTLREVEYLRTTHLDDIDRMSRIETLKHRLNALDLIQNGKIDELIRNKKIDTTMATSLINDASFGLYICKRLIDITMILWVEDDVLLELGEENED